MNTDQWLAEYRDKVDGIKQMTANLEENIADATTTASSPDQAVTVTVGANGALLNLEFGHHAAEHSYVQLAALVMKTVARAQHVVAEKVVTAFGPLGMQTGTIDLLTRYVPAEEPDEDHGAGAFDDLAPAPQPVPPWEAEPAAPARVSVARAVSRNDDDDDMSEERPW